MEIALTLQSLLMRKDIPDDAKTIINHSIAKQEKERRETHRYRTLYKEVPIGLYRTTPDGKILASNPYLIEILGYDSFEDIQKIDLEKKGFLPTYPRSEFKRILEELGSIAGLESIWKRKDNSLIYVRENAKAIRDESGNILYYEGSVEDITESRKAEEELIKTKARLEYLLTSCPAVIYTCEPRGHYKTTFMSSNIKEILGYLPEDFIDSPTFWETIIHPEEKDRVIADFKGTVQTGYYSDVYRVKHKNGYYCWMFEENKLIKDDLGNPIEIIGYWTNITDRKEAEEELRESEKRFRQLVETSPDGITLTDLTGQILIMNNQGLKMLGYHEQELLNMNSFDLIVPEDQELAYENMLKTLKLGKTEGLEYTIIRKDGSHFPVELNATVIFDDDGNPRNFMATIRDITERRQTEEALRASEARWRALVDHAPDIILTVDKKGRILFINNPPAGLTREEVLNTSVFDYVEPQYREVVQQSIESVFQTGLPTDYEIAARGPYDQVSWYATHLGPLIRNGEVHAVTLITRDITDRKIAEIALRAERDQAQKYLDVVGVIIVAIDKNQDITLINKKGCEFLGFQEEEIIGKNWFDNFIPQRIQKDVKAVFNQLMVGEVEPVEFFENSVLTKSGEERTITWHNIVLKDDEGNIIGTLSSGEDITEKKKLEKVRIELEKHRENFIWMTSHELRTPITVILGYTEFFQRHFEELDRNRIERILKVMRNNIDRLERLTTDVTMVSKIERGFLEIDKKELKLKHFLKEAVETYEHLLGEQFIFNAPIEESITIELDKDRIQQILDNILNNAIKNTHAKHRRILMNVEAFSNEIQIVITDNGAGVRPENLERIFNQFLSIETEYSACGTGIGLFISREIINAHDGTISAHSDGIGHGAQFIISLPRG